MNNYNLTIMIAIMTLPFRHHEFIKNDYYVKCCIGEISYDDFIYKMFSLINEELFVKDLDEFILILESIFPQKKCSKKEALRFYFEILKRLGSSLLLIMDSKVYLNQTYINSRSDLFSKYNENQRILIWYYLSRYMDMTMVIINHLQYYVECIDNFIHQDSGIHLHVINNYQNNIFKEGFYETHVHFGGAIGFNIQWWSVVGKWPFTNSTYESIKSLNKINALKTNTFNYSIYVMGSLVIRYLMMKLVYCYFNKNKRVYLQSGKSKKNIDEEFGVFIDKYASGNLNTDDELFIKKLIEKINREIQINCQNNKYSDYIGIYIGKKNECQSENVFIFQCVRYINNVKNSAFKELFIQCFLNYLRIKNSFFALKIQTNAVKGLSYFGNFYHANVNKCLTVEEKMKLLLDHYYHQEKVRGVELKIAQLKNVDFDNLAGAYHESILRFVNYYQKWLNTKDHLMKLGLILMFKKEKLNTNQICYEKFLTEGKYHYLRYGKLQIDIMATIMTIQHLRNIIPKLEKFIIGIDVAGNEYYCEPGIFAPAYRLVKNPYHEVVEESRNINLVNLYERYQLFPIKNLGLTFHVGEVFSSVVSGLRHIDEVISKFNYTEGDRIGHGIALALDLKRYLRDKKVTQIKKIDYLQNLLWIYLKISKDELTFNINESSLENKILSTFRSIFSQDDDYTVDIHILIDWYNYSFISIDQKLRKLNKKGCYFSHLCENNTDKKNNHNWNLEELLAAEQCGYYLKKMNESILITENKDDYELYSDLQKYVRKKVANKGIIVEINPVSNSLIGDIDDITLLPYLNLDAIGFNLDSSKNVLLTINTDDPAIFNTDLLFQFALLEAQFSNMGYSKKEINEWLNFVRKNSFYSTFLQTTASFEQEKKMITNLIDELRR